MSLGDWLADTLRPHPFRGKLRLLDPLLPRTGERAARIGNAVMQLDLADGIQRNIYLGTYEPHETALVREWLKPGMTFVDAGANVGYFTAVAAGAVGPHGRVFSVEPQPYAYQRLQAMVDRNGLSQVRAFQGGLSSAEGELPLYLPPESRGEHNATMVAAAEASSRRISVPVKTLDASLDEWGVERIDLLKIDVEGHEPQVFDGARRALAERRIGAILCEFNEFWLRHAGSGAHELHERLTRAGFADRDGAPTFHAASMETRFLSLRPR